MMEKRIQTKNHIDIYSYPNRHTHSFCLSLYVKAGCIYEPDRDNGITHFLEHLLFRNINHSMDGQMYRTLDKLGLYFNGATYKEFMQLFIIGAPQHFAEAADILLKVFEPVCLPAAEIKTEQQRVKAEIREAEDFKSLDYFAGTFVWEGTPARNPILGTKGNVSRFTRQKIEQYRAEILSGGNAFLYVTGCVTEEDIAELAEKVDRCSVTTGGIVRDNCVQIPADFGKRPLQVHVKNSEYSMVQFSFDFVTERYTGAELALLYDILFSGENSLIHQELSEKRGWIYSYQSALEKYCNVGRIYFTYEISRKERDKSIALVMESLRLLTDAETLEERLAYVLPEYIDNAYMVYDDNEGFNWQRSYECHIMGNNRMTIEEGRDAYKAVTAKRLRNMAAEIFRMENLVLSLKGKKSQIDTRAVETVLKQYV